MSRFVVLEHDHPTRHWDLMLDMFSNADEGTIDREASDDMQR